MRKSLSNAGRYKGGEMKTVEHKWQVGDMFFYESVDGPTPVYVVEEIESDYGGWLIYRDELGLKHRIAQRYCIPESR